jgi:hypothetical protein
MTAILEGKRKILIGSSNPGNQTYLSQEFSKHISNCSFYFAHDGVDVISKINNDVPHLMILEESLPKKSAIQITQYILNQKKFEKLAIIIISSIPDTDHFVDEVISGRIQFTSNHEENLSKYIARAMNFISHGDNSEFRLSFLAEGDVLMREGDQASFVYILRKGSLKAITEKSGNTVILGTVQPGEFVGEMAYINGEARSASIIALSDCELIEIPVNKLDHILFQKPAWSKALVRTLSKRVSRGNEKVAKAVTE